MTDKKCNVVNDQLYVYFVDIFEKLLCAFRKKYSCQSVLTKMIEDWKLAIDENEIVGALFMDLMIIDLMIFFCITSIWLVVLKPHTSQP